MACIYLACKNSDERRRIRGKGGSPDIINVVHVISSLYRSANTTAAEKRPDLYEKSEDQVKYIDLCTFVDPASVSDMNKLLPTFSYSKVACLY